MEAPQDQILVLVFPGVTGGEILEETTVCPKNVVHLGHHILDVKYHATYPAIIIPVVIIRKTVLRHVLKTLHCNCLFDGIFTFFSIWDCQIRVKVAGNKELRNMGSLFGGHHYALQGEGAVQHKISSENVLLLPSCNHLEADITMFGPCI